MLGEMKSVGCQAEGEATSKKTEEDFNLGNNKKMPPVEKRSKIQSSDDSNKS